MWKVKVFTLYPDLFPGPLSSGLYKKALDKKAYLWISDGQTGFSITEVEKEENGTQKILKFNGGILSDSTKNIFNITFKTKDGYYYSKSPSLTSISSAPNIFNRIFRSSDISRGITILTL